MCAVGGDWDPGWAAGPELRALEAGSVHYRTSTLLHLLPAQTPSSWLEHGHTLCFKNICELGSQWLCRCFPETGPLNVKWEVLPRVEGLRTG